jgi:hypothetical protein
MPKIDKSLGGTKIINPEKLYNYQSPQGKPFTMRQSPLKKLPYVYNASQVQAAKEAMLKIKSS